MATAIYSRTVRMLAQLLVVSISIVGIVQATRGGQSGSDAGQSKPSYQVVCRWIDAKGNVVIAPKQTLPDSKTGSFSSSSETPFVIGVDPVGCCLMPHISMIDEGMKVDVTVAGKQSDGATVDIVLEQSKVTDVEKRETAPHIFIQEPHVSINKKRIIRFVKFGQVLVVPMGEKSADGMASRVELVLGAAEEVDVPSNWFSSPMDERRVPDKAEHDEYLKRLLMAGTARIRCERVSQWEKFRGRPLHDDLDSLQQQSVSRYVLGLGKLYCSYYPYQTAMASVAPLAACAIGDLDRVQRFEEALLGHDWVYSVELLDSPQLIGAASSLAYLPELWNVTVTSKRCGYGLLHALTKINVRHNLVIHESPETESPKDEWLQKRWCLHHDSPGYASLTLEASATVFVDEAETVTPMLKATANLKRVLVMAECGRDTEKTEQARLERGKVAMQRELPSVEVTSFLWVGEPHRR